MIVGDMREDRLALDILCKVFLTKSTQDTLVYIYEEYEVRDVNIVQQWMCLIDQGFI